MLLLELQDLVLAIPALGVVATLFLVFMRQNSRDLRNELRDVRSEVRDSRDDIRDGNETLALILAEVKRQNGDQRIKRKRRPKAARLDVRGGALGSLQPSDVPILGRAPGTGPDTGAGH